MALTPDHVVIIDGDAWIAYELLLGPGNTAPEAGYPVTDQERCDGGKLIQLRGGEAGPGGFIYRDDERRWVWVAGQIWLRYVELGGPAGPLGLPRDPAVEDPSGVTQTFDGGSLYAPALFGALTDEDRSAGTSRPEDSPPPEDAPLPPAAVCGP